MTSYNKKDAEDMSSDLSYSPYCYTPTHGMDRQKSTKQANHFASDKRIQLPMEGTKGS